MPGNNVADFTKRLQIKLKKERLKEIVSASGWEINGDVIDGSEVCVYLIDKTESAIVLFGCKKMDLIEPEEDDAIHWGHFMSAWDVIADPDLPYDEKHKDITIKFFLRALPNIALWPPVLKKVLSEIDKQRAHILIIIDRDNMESPLDIILARSESLLMNTASIQSIIDNYKDSV